jgi:hypothetical protein
LVKIFNIRIFNRAAVSGRWIYRAVTTIEAGETTASSDFLQKRKTKTKRKNTQRERERERERESRGQGKDFKPTSTRVLIIDHDRGSRDFFQSLVPLI